MHARRLLINSMRNMRDLGGYQTLDGNVTQFGRFVRSDAPCGISREDIEFLIRYGIRHVIDLRWQDEAVRSPCSLINIPEINYRNIPFTDDTSYLGSMDFCPRDHYVPILKHSHRIKDIFIEMAECPDDAILFHCAAGKDRTGMIAAMLLLLAKVPENDIMSDYQVTFTYIRDMAVSIKASGRSLDLMKSEPEWIEPMLKYIDGKGGIENYLLGIGVMKYQIDKLKIRLTGNVTI